MCVVWLKCGTLIKKQKIGMNDAKSSNQNHNDEENDNHI